VKCTINPPAFIYLGNAAGFLQLAAGARQSDSVILTLLDMRYNTVMKHGERGLWTIEELFARVVEALSMGYEGVPSSRVRDVPDLRTIRYYTTLGLLDRPAATRGRTALYGSRHLLQLVAIKHLQAQGLSLAAVRERVLGLSDAALRRIVGPPILKRKIEPPAPRANSFWRLAANAPSLQKKGAAFARASERAVPEELARAAFRSMTGCCSRC
jgi:DNA-binding transcriptional MerR regulator